MAEMNIGAAIESEATSWIYLILFVVFFLVCIRVRGNFKFIGAFFRDLVVVKERENLFDATLKETSFIFLVLLLSGCSLGVLLGKAVSIYGNAVPMVADIPDLGFIVTGELPRAAVCMGIACLYIGAMWVCYTIVGKVFSDNLHTWLWVRGFSAGMGLGAVFFFPLALFSIAYPEASRLIVLISFGMLILVKFLFIVKGFRIFFSESALWVVFLYYLCSLEIVPLFITFGLAYSALG